MGVRHEPLMYWDQSAPPAAVPPLGSTHPGVSPVAIGGLQAVRSRTDDSDDPRLRLRAAHEPGGMPGQIGPAVGPSIGTGGGGYRSRTTNIAQLAAWSSPCSAIDGAATVSAEKAVAKDRQLAQCGPELCRRPLAIPLRTAGRYAKSGHISSYSTPSGHRAFPKAAVERKEAARTKSRRRLLGGPSNKGLALNAVCCPEQIIRRGILDGHLSWDR
jgi:hypothetical protein